MKRALHSRVTRRRVAIFTLCLLAFALAGAARVPAAKANFCGCSGKYTMTSAQTKNWNDQYFASKGGGNRLTIIGVSFVQSVTHPIVAANAENDVYRISRVIKANTLAWFKANIKKPSGNTKLSKEKRAAMKGCLIAGTFAFLKDLAQGTSKKKALDDGTWDCLGAMYGYYLAKKIKRPPPIVGAGLYARAEFAH